MSCSAEFQYGLVTGIRTNWLKAHPTTEIPTAREYVRHQLHQQFQPILRLQLIQSMWYLFNLIIQNVLESRPQFLREFVGSSLLSSPEFLPCRIRHSTANYYGLRTVREGRWGASTRYHKRFPRFIEYSLAFEGFLQCPEFIEVGVQRVRELSRSGYWKPCNVLLQGFFDWICRCDKPNLNPWK